MSGAHCWVQGLWTRTGPKIFLPPSVGDQEAARNGGVWAAFGTPASVGVEAARKAGAHGNRELFQGPGYNICLQQGPIWKCDSKRKKDRGRKKRRKKGGRERREPRETKLSIE